MNYWKCLAKSESLNSENLTTISNKWLYVSHRVEDMMKRSFAEIDSARHEVDRKQALEDLEQSITGLGQLDCPVCFEDIDQYYSACARIAHLRREMQVCESMNQKNRSCI